MGKSMDVKKLGLAGVVGLGAIVLASRYAPQIDGRLAAAAGGYLAAGIPGAAVGYLAPSLLGARNGGAGSGAGW